MPSHGALSKAGKVRRITPIVKKEREKRNDSPRIKNRKKYYRRFLLRETIQMKSSKGKSHERKRQR